MKRKSIIYLCALVVLASCSKGYSDPMDGQYDKPRKVEDIVTVKQDADGTVYLQSRGGERFYPGAGCPFERQQRAMCSMTIYAEEIPLYGHRVEVGWLEPLDEGLLYNVADTDSKSSSDDGIDLLDDWITQIGDGYLSVHYNAWWGEPAGLHYIGLEYEPGSTSLTLVHDAAGDARDIYTDGMVCFDISSLFGDADGTQITLNWTKTTGEKASKKFEYDARK